MGRPGGGDAPVCHPPPVFEYVLCSPPYPESGILQFKGIDIALGLLSVVHCFPKFRFQIVGNLQRPLISPGPKKPHNNSLNYCTYLFLRSGKFPGVGFRTVGFRHIENYSQLRIHQFCGSYVFPLKQRNVKTKLELV